ncbi:hypothetical protein EGW08_019561 [Elysia chlorotica]|uniref:Receptor protein-tyrosine kinase n=1 Tax=Elysia chlorotica TaxID=188477 RepID=A0A433STR4_ELYCH|nr:hypothetical protein EGW08_019561 [Elysia chlorotica]
MGKKRKGSVMLRRMYAVRLLTAACLGTLISLVPTVQSEFLSPGAFRAVSVHNISVSQNCDDEFACRSGSFNSTNCQDSGVCSKVLECNGREGFPPVEYPLGDWQMSQTGLDTAGCTLRSEQPQNPPSVTFPRPGIRTLVVNGSAVDLNPCYTQRAEPLNSSFALVFWLKADCRNCSVLEVPQTNNAESIHLRVVENSLCVDTYCTDMLTKGQWKLITVRAFMNEVTIYIGKDRVNFPRSFLDNVFVENLYIGSSEIILMTDIFELYDVRFYEDALSTGEITEEQWLYRLKKNLFGNCKCPAAFPDIDDSDSGFCTDGTSTTTRYNTTVHFNKPETMLDERTDVRWASADTGSVTVTLDLGHSFQIGEIKVIFLSALTFRMEATLVSDSLDMHTYNFSCTGSECIIDLSKQQSPSIVGEYNQLKADVVEINIHRSGSNHVGSFVISEIYVSGRCDCHGNANSCTYDQNGGYECACDAGTNTKGAACDTCMLNYIKLPEQFGCPLACSCNPAGVINVNDTCDPITGQCKCKSNVAGSECDTCKSFTYNLEASNPDGCSVCNCNQTGAIACSNITGECECRGNTVSDQCDQCSANSYSFADGCKLCDCSTDGTVGQRTDCTESGQCYCKENVIGPKCDQCKPGFYDLSLARTFGCTECLCHPSGSENGICDPISGQCTCRGGVSAGLVCNPVITSIDPTFGPESGGTRVTIKGQLLGNDSHSIDVMLGDDLQQVIERDDTTIIFSTKGYNRSGGSKASSLRLEWVGNGNVINTSFSFLYLTNPVIDVSRNESVITYQRGGCPVEVHGSYLQNVKYPRLEMKNLGHSSRALYAPCSLKSNHLLCITPDTSSIVASTGSNNYQMRVLLDGLTVKRDVKVLANPVVNDAGNIEFQYPFEDTVTLTGSNLLSSCSVTVHIGVVSCELRHVSDTAIEFAPPVAPPGGQKKNNIEVHIGQTKLSVGTLQYLELYETTVFIIIVSCIGAAILIVVVLVIICCCCRSRRNHLPPKTNSSTGVKMSNGADNKENIEVDARPMNTYSELVTLVDAPDVPATSNGYNSPIQMETVMKEHKKGIVNSEAENNILAEEFLPRVEPGIREDVKRCYVGSGHFVLGRKCYLRGHHTQLVDGTLQKNGTAVQKLTIKSVVDPLKEHDLPMWATLALSECLRLRRFKHNHVLSIIGIGANQQQFHILYPYMAQGILKSVVSDTSKDFSVRQLLGFSQQVAEGITFLSSKDVTHKDVAARNCMIDEYSVVKLSDASFSWDIYPDEYVYDQARERYLPIRWMAPESLTDGYYDMRTDVWSFAVLVWELLTRGCLPFHEVTDSAGVSEYILQGYILGRPDTLSVDVYELLRSCWSPENESRPGIATVSRTLSEILEAEDDETYANAGDLASFEHQHSSGLAATPRQHNGGGNIYSTTKLSRV